MTPERYQRVKEIFYAVCNCEDADRAQLLEEECQGDAQLLAEVEELLDAQERGSDFLERPVLGDGALRGAVHPTLRAKGALSPDGVIPERIGRYRIVRLLGEGGMGLVFEAEQDTPKRRVALKVIRPGALSPKLLRRFEHEVHLLGRLQHPGIAQIFEAGRADNGAGAAPFFAMELVEGQPLVDYAETKRLDMSARLELVAEVCDAVQHAHQRGVIHRDLKPANIMVDGSGQPKVLDFGVARATDSDVQMTTLRTDVGLLVGTIAYMSPEQVAGDSALLDTRCDVYALGVILYQLLCGRLPFDLARKSVPDAVRTIRDEEPTRISSISKAFRGDLETILLKALEKDRENRYQSASELAADIRRFLKDEPIGARPPSVPYQLRKFARRNKAVAAGVLVAVVGLTLGTGAAVWKALEATTERDRAVREARKAERINTFLQQMLSSADPAIADYDTTVREALDRATAVVDSELADEPEVRAAVHHQIGQIYHRLTRFEEAEQHLRIALTERRRLFGDDHEAAVTLTDLAWALLEQGDFDGAERTFEESLAVMRKVHGNEHPEVAILYACLAGAKNVKHEWAAAESLARDSLARLERLLGPEHENIAFAQATLAHSLCAQGETEEAEQLYRRALSMQRRLLGDHHLQIVFTLANFARCLDSQGRTPEAAALREEAAAIRQRRVGRQITSSTHP